MEDTLAALAAGTLAGEYRVRFLRGELSCFGRGFLSLLALHLFTINDRFFQDFHELHDLPRLGLGNRVMTVK